MKAPGTIFEKAELRPIGLQYCFSFFFCSYFLVYGKLLTKKKYYLKKFSLNKEI